MAKSQRKPAPALSQEIEAKFSARDSHSLDSLREAHLLAPDTILGPGQRVTTRDTYYDTPEFAFIRAGYALRIRTLAERTDEPAVVTLKGLESLPRAASARPIHQREEIEGPILPGKRPLQTAAWPAPVRRKVKEIGGPRPALRPILILAQERCKRAVLPTSSPADAPMAELSLDTVAVFDPGGADAVRVGEFAEVELELLPTEPTELDPFAVLTAALAALPSLTPVGQSKPAHGLTLISAHPAGSTGPDLGMRPEQGMAEAGRVVWRQELMKILLCEAGVRLGEDMEYVHDMRVASRRARAALTMFGPYFQAKALDEYAKRLRKTAQILGDVRDLDVALDNLDRYVQGKSGKAIQGSAELRAHWQQEHAAARTDLLRWLDNQKYRRFVADFAAFCTHAQVGATNFTHQPGLPPVPHQVRHVLPGAIWTRFERVRTYETLFAPQYGEHGAAETDARIIPDETLHQLRIDVKALRYNLDFAQHLLGSEGQLLLKQLKQLQSHLGDLNDAVVKAARLESLRQDGLDSPFLAHYIDVQIEIADRLRRTFPALWERFNRPETRSRVARALARI